MLFSPLFAFLLKSEFLSEACFFVSPKSLVARYHHGLPVTAQWTRRFFSIPRIPAFMEQTRHFGGRTSVHDYGVPTTLQSRGASCRPVLERTHVAALRNVPHILRTVKPILEPTLFEAHARVLTMGTPSYCVAHSSEANYQTYRK
jgi:hypothetical protein